MVGQTGTAGHEYDRTGILSGESDGGTMRITEKSVNVATTQTKGKLKMKTTHKWMTTAILATSIMLAGSAWAGDLTPPGAPGSTMHTLEEIHAQADAAEPRIPIPGGASIYAITTSGSYYLQANMSRTLTISADNVTVDLMGYTIDPSSGDAINIPGDRKNLVVRNGILTGASTGVDARYLRGSNSRFENLTVSDCSYCGLYIGSDCVVENCLLIDNGSYGIQSSSAGRLEVRNCRIKTTTGVGLVAAGGSRIIDNTIEDSDDDGLRLTGTDSYVGGNIIKGNADNYDIAQSNQLNLLLCEIPETLDWTCSAKLAGTVSTTQTTVNGITVNANNVTIDMAGHALVGPGAESGSGIYQADTYHNLRVFNGKVLEWRGSYKGGVYANGSSAKLADVQASTNYYGIVAGNGSTLSGCATQYNTNDGINTKDSCTLSGCTAQYNTNDGIETGDGCTLSDCAVQHNTGYGIYAGGSCTFSGCSAQNNTGVGIFADEGSTLSGCAAQLNTSYGIYAGSGCTLSGCAAQYNTGDGIFAQGACTLSYCTAQHNTGDGIKVSYNSRIVGSTCSYNGNSGDGAGIHATSLDNRIEGNTCTENDRGIHVDYSGNFIARNTCSDNTLFNWDVAEGNVCLVIQATTGAAIIGNSGGAAPGSTDPNANFTY